MAYQSINPYTEEQIETFPQIIDADLDRVLDRAEPASPKKAGDAGSYRKAASEIPGAAYPRSHSI